MSCGGVENGSPTPFLCSDPFPMPKVDVRGSLKYDLSSVSNLTYSGTPSKVDGKKSGGSTISHR